MEPRNPAGEYDPNPGIRGPVDVYSIESAGLQGEALVDWVIEASPSHFGYSWHFGIELIETLRLLGRVAELRPQEVA